MEKIVRSRKAAVRSFVPVKRQSFSSGGRIHGIFENEGTYDIDTQIIPFLTHINAALHLRSDTGERAEVYFVNSKDMTPELGAPPSAL